MRVFIALLIILFAAWYFMGRPDPVPVEESFIAEPVKKLREAESMNETYLQQADEHKKRLEQAVDGDGG